MNSNATASYAEQARARKIAKATAMGIDDRMISRLVESFYDRVREDELLGPVFAVHISDWPLHLTRMKDFLASVTMESGRFHGSPMTKHIAIGNLEQTHFDRWLSLWFDVVQDVAPPTAVEALQAAAQRIARSLLTGIEIDRGGLDAVSSRMATAS